MAVKEPQRFRPAIDVVTSGRSRRAGPAVVAAGAPR